MDEFIQDSCGPAVSQVPPTLKMMQETLDFAERIIMKWKRPGAEAGRVTMAWDSQTEETILYFNAVDEVQGLMGALSAPWSDKALLNRALHILEVAMFRLKEQLKQILVQNSEVVHSDWLLASTNSEGEDDLSVVLSDRSDDEDEEDIPVAHPVTNLSLAFDPIPSERVRDLCMIVQRLVKAEFGKESCQIFVNVRKAVLEQSLYRLGMERPNLKELQKMAWKMLDLKIAKWIQALKVGVRVVLACEKKLCDNVFIGMNPWGETCFAELATESMMQILAVGKAIAATHRAPEKLFRVLDMYEMLNGILPDINAIFCDKSCMSVRSEACGLLLQIAETAQGTLQELERAIRRDPAKNPVPGGAFHPLSCYVMNYVNFLGDYADSLEKLLEGQTREVPRFLVMETFGLTDSLRDNEVSKVDHVPPLTVQIMWLIVLLERNLYEKSKLYKDGALEFLFLMNNINYIVQKVQQSQLLSLLGVDWVRKHSSQVHIYAANYVKTAWERVFACLRDEGITHSGASRVVMKDRFKSFNLTFEEACRAQSGWVVPDPQLREDLRIAIADKLIPAYQEFMSRFGIYLQAGSQPDRYVKYSPDDLENCVIDLFDGGGNQGQKSSRLETCAAADKKHQNLA